MCSSSWTFFFCFFFFFFLSRSLIISSSSSSSSSWPTLVHLSSTVNNVTLYGDAHLRNTSISLTQELTCLPPITPFYSFSPPPPSYSGVGRALYVYPIRFLDPSANATASFSCRFSFSIVPSPLCPFGDGFAFLITSNAAFVGESDGHFGFPAADPDHDPDDTDSFVAVEFDTTFDPALGDINGNHVGIDVGSAVSFASADSISGGVDLKSRRRMTAWIDYRDPAKTVRVWIGNALVRPSSPVLTAQIDLSRHFREFMHVGFTASNGGGSAIHRVHHWRFKTSGFAPPAAPVDTAVVEEGDCFMCFPEEEEEEEDGGRKGSSGVNVDGRISKLDLLLISTAAIAFLISSAAIFAIGYRLVRRSQSPSLSTSPAAKKRSQGGRFSINPTRVPSTLTLAEVKSATSGFNPNRIIGEGASATVYKGRLTSGDAVAVKRFSQADHGGDGGSGVEYHFRDPFSTEFAMMASCLRHKNLVQLQGWCCEGNELVLVYEYLPNGSLDKLLHSSPSYLSWDRRLRIIRGVAAAIAYLHEECERQIIHRDVKACNIMLDVDFNAKLGDFGLAEIYDHSTSAAARGATIPAGTMGYLAPEYVYSGVPTEKTDVYSFGVVVLELATGRRPVEDDGVAVTEWTWEMWERGRLLEAADLKLRGRFNAAEMKRMLMVGLACVHPNSEKRPRVKEAARMISGEAQPPTLPPRKPTVRIHSTMMSGGSSHDLLRFGGDGSTTTTTPSESVRTRGHGQGQGQGQGQGSGQGQWQSIMDDPLWQTPKTHFSCRD